MAASFNFGQCTACFKHKDYGNLPFGMCCITALGDFDPMKGGHLVLWECRLVIEFPPGSSILIPSGSIHHSNVSIRPCETRYSMMQYAAGGLFRWVEHGFQKEELYFKGLSAQGRAEELARKLGRKDFGLSLFSTLNELNVSEG
jgi:hypothetical protein